ncbi:MAG: MBL fold metallo-hydrolase [Deltaproteobacteria bacterium]|nr:MBL fold metallo-hydrolase [Deltaproteobacteria bacterium]
MKVTFWGVRGSIATSGPEFAGVGGNTTCVEVEAEGERLIIDAGTGLRALGSKLATEARLLGRPVKATLLFSHLHWDHIQGFPFFGPAFAPTTELDLHGSSEGEVTLEEALRRQMQPPLFPVRLEDMAAKKRFHSIDDGSTFEVGGFRIRTRALEHPQGTLGYRIEHGHRAFCFATDTEHPRDGSVDEALVDLARDVDLFVCDGQYTEAEYEGGDGSGPPRRGWGHMTYVAATRAARAAHARRLVLTHHDPAHDDAMIGRIERDAESHFAGTRAARECRPFTV